MSSSTTSPAVTTESRTSGAGIFIALVPWVVFTILAQHVSLELGSLIALVAAVVIAFPGLRAGRPKMLELGAVVTFAAFAVVSLAADHHTATDVARYARGIAAAGLAVIAFTSLFFVPFTEQYAREQVDERLWSSPRFKSINRRLTVMWGAVFAAMVPFHIVAGALDRPGTNILFNWVVPVALVVWAVKQSSAAGDDSPASELA
jgi:pyruvoyl-dependent arginine decarboxylase (PvlArgDC)